MCMDTLHAWLKLPVSLSFCQKTFQLLGFCVLTMVSFALFLPVKGQVNLYLHQYCWLNSLSPLATWSLLTPLLTRLSEIQSMERIQPETIFQPTVWSGMPTQQQELHRIVRECQRAGFFRKPSPQTPMCQSGFSTLCYVREGSPSPLSTHVTYSQTGFQRRLDQGSFVMPKEWQRAGIVELDASRTESETRSFVVYGIILFIDFKKNSF